MTEVILDSQGYVEQFNLNVDKVNMQGGILISDEIDETHFIYNCHFYKVEDNHFIFDEAKKNIYTHQMDLSFIRMRRQAECFSVVDRSQLWYNTLTPSQLAELQEWYEAWLVAPDTLIIPTKPDFLQY